MSDHSVLVTAVSPLQASSPGGEILRALWSGLSASPITLLMLALLVVLALLRSVRAARWVLLPRDPLRRFTRADKALILARAGGRCEHHGLLDGRCRVTDRLEADHIHPHSRGGRTSLNNGQALCTRHNRRKSARVPYGWQLDRLATRRADYYPPGISTTVIRPSRRRATAGSANDGS
jgi:hypothetical protein